MSSSNNTTPYQNIRPTLSLTGSNSENHMPSRSNMPLSPKTTNVLSADKDTIFQLQLEIQTLKQRLSVSSSTGKNELMELVQEKESVIQTKSRQVAILTEKFQKISKAFTGMEEEVAKLRDSKNQLEDENQKLKRHLNIREKEVATLVTRCTSQEEKLMQNKEAKVLEKQLNEVMAQLRASDEKLQHMQLLEEQFAASKRSQEDMVKKYENSLQEKDMLEHHFQQTKEDLQQMLRDKDDVLTAMRHELASAKEMKDKQELEHLSLNNSLREKEEALSVALKEVAFLQDEKVKNREEIVRINNDLLLLKSEVSTLKLTESRLKENVDESSTFILKLQSQVEAKDKIIANMEADFKNKIQGITRESNNTKEEYEGMLLESEEQFKELESLYEQEQKKVEKLKNELIQSTAHSTKQDELRRAEVKALEENLKSFKSQAAERDKESSAYLLDLKQEKEKIFGLEAQIKVLEKAREQVEMEGARVAEGLRKQLEQATFKYAKLEEEKNFVATAAKKDSEHFELMIDTLESQFNDMKSDIAAKDAQLEQRQSTINTLVKTKSQLEQKIASYRSDLEMINQGYDNAKADYETKSKQHREMIEKMIQRHEEEKQSFASDFEELDSFARQTQQQLEEISALNESLKRDVQEKNDNISKLVEQNINLEKQLEEIKSSLSIRNEKLAVQSKQLESLKKSLDDLRITKDVEINKHLDALDTERTAKLIALKKVTELTDSLERHHHNNDLESLRAENFLLKDKIDRQEAYLKRKLAKEKAMRTAPSSMIKSPPRPRSNSLTRSRSPPPPPPPPTIHSESRSLSESSRSSRWLEHDDNLDDILG